MKTGLFVFLILFSTALSAQDNKESWQGIIPAGGKFIRLLFHISKAADGSLATVMDSPDQNAFGIACGITQLKGDSLIIEIPLIKGSYRGKKQDTANIQGTFTQGANQLNLSLKKLQPNEVPQSDATKTKAQTPKPPFDYVSEEVIYTNTNQKIKLGATLTKPKGDGQFPVVILISGSGAQDRDGTIGMHKPFHVIADYLTKQGIAVLRVDDRGVGKSSGDFSKASSADFATDVTTGIDYLKTRKDIDSSKIGLMGHSEGGMIAPYVAARRKDLAFIVLLAAPIVGGKETMYFQAVEKPLAKLSAHDRNAYGEFYLKMLEYALQSTTPKDLETFTRATYTDWKKNLPDSTFHTLIKGTDEEAIKSLTTGFTDLKRPWWRFFLTYDIASDLKKVQIPVFALHGSKDEQVDPNANLTLIKRILAQNKNPRYQVFEVRGLNHLFQHCKECGSVKEYMDLDESFDPYALSVIGTWINLVLKK